MPQAMEIADLPTLPSRRWSTVWISEQPSISFKKIKKLERSRVEACTIENMNDFITKIAADVDMTK